MIENPESEPSALEIAIYDAFRPEWPQCKVILGWSHVYDGVRDITVCHERFGDPAHCEVLPDRLELSAYFHRDGSEVATCETFAKEPLATPPHVIVEMLRIHIDLYDEEDDEEFIEEEAEYEEDDDE